MGRRERVVDGGRRRLGSVVGVDFSGARLAGRTTWIARCRWRDRPSRLRLESLESLERLSGTAEREGALVHLVRMIRESRDALWAIDAPFGLPVEVLDPGTTWPGQLRLVREWTTGGYDLGVWALRRAKARGHRGHIRRLTDQLARAPFDPYHYRIIYQTFHAMRDVVAALARDPDTAVLPFHYDRVHRASRVIVETCPSSTLKRLGLPYHNYKQPGGGTLTAKRRATRRVLLGALADLVEIEDRELRRVARDPGGDALDAVLAAIGAAQAWRLTDHAAVAANPRVRREGYLYA